MIDNFLSSEGRIGRAAFILRIAVLAGIVAGVSFAAIDYFSDWHGGHYSALGSFFGILAAIFCLFIGLMQLLKRLRDMGKPAYWTLLFLIPGVNILALFYTAVAPSKA